MKQFYTYISKPSNIRLLWAVMFFALSAGIKAQSDFVLFPADVTVECDNIPPTAVIGVEVTGIDNCGANNFTITQIGGDVITAGTCPNSFTITRTWELSDPDCIPVNVDRSQVITVQDNTTPTFTQPVNITISCMQSTLPATTG
jgi:hypothetical protein